MNCLKWLVSKMGIFILLPSSIIWIDLKKQWLTHRYVNHHADFYLNHKEQFRLEEICFHHIISDFSKNIFRVKYMSTTTVIFIQSTMKEKSLENAVLPQKKNALHWMDRCLKCRLFCIYTETFLVADSLRICLYIILPQCASTSICTKASFNVATDIFARLVKF